MIQKKYAIGVCVVCGKDSGFRWTDSHGIGACSNCGCCYRVYHYDENNKPIEKPPECTIKEGFLQIIKDYWDKYHRNCMPGSHNFSGSNDETATKDDFDCFNDYMEDLKDRGLFPKEEKP